jgi:hypothetical protein
MRHVRTFEYKQEKYVIITYIDGELAISVKFINLEDKYMSYHKYTPYIFQFISNFDHNIFEIRIYTESEAKKEILQIINYYNENLPEDSGYKFEIITLDDCDILVNSNKYNL